MTENRIPLAGVIGSPIAHSKSPALHGYWLKRYGLKGFYIPMDVAQVDLRQVLETLPLIGFVGANVTIPHKESVLKIADIVTDRAALIGAANTLIFRKDGRIHADNTDGAGFVANLRQNAPGWAPQASPGAVVNDLVYTPLRTHFLDEAQARGCITVDGLGMLLHQAAPGFERWFGTRPEVDEDTRQAVLMA